MSKFDDCDISTACDILGRGGLIVYPTDTVWGIGCDATNTDAVAKVYALKHRVDSKALITLVGSIEAVYAICPDMTDATAKMLNGINSRPTTVIIPSARGLASNLTASDGSVAVRITRETFSAALCRAYNRPIVSTSANISGQPTPAIFTEITSEIIEGVDYVCTTRRDDMHRSAPSIVAKVGPDGTITILRK